MVICAKCGLETNSKYLVRQLGMLCGDCAKQYGESKILEMKKELANIQYKIQREHNKINEAIQADCKHTNAIDTGYSLMDEKEMVSVWKCPDCGYVFNKQVKLTK